MAESRARTLAKLANENALSVDGSSLDVGISSTSPDSDLNAGASIKMDGPSGIITATSFSGDGAALTGIANTAIIAANQLTVTGVVTAASFAGDGSALTGVANTDFVVSTATTTARLVVTNGVNVSGLTTTKLKDNIRLTRNASFTLTGTAGPFSNQANVFQDQVATLDELPSESVHNHVVKVINSGALTSSYFLKYVANNGTSGPGY